MGMDESLAEAEATLVALAEAHGSDRGEVLWDREGALVRIRWRDASARHALSLSMMVQWARAVRWLRSQPVSAVWLQGGDATAFCAGGNLREVEAGLGTPEAGVAMSWAMTTVLDALVVQPAVVVASVAGPAVGGGCELMTAADHRIWSSGGRAMWRQARLGVAPGWGGARRLTGLVGRRTALRWLTTGATVEPPEARTSGLADRVVAADALDQAVEDFLEPVLARPVAAVRACKRQVVSASAQEAARAQVDAFASVWGGPSHQRGGS